MTSTVKIESGLDLSPLKANNEAVAQDQAQAQYDVAEPVEEPEPLPELLDDPIKKRSLIMECQRYRNHRVGKKRLTMFDCSTETLEAKTCAELESLLEEMDTVLCTSSNTAMFNGAVRGGLFAYEYAAINFTPLKIQGLNAQLQQMEEFDDVVGELELKYCKNMVSSPEKRFIGMIAAVSYQLHLANSTQAVPQTSPEWETKYKDL